MAESTSAGIRSPYTDVRNLKWSPAEKAIARRAFDRALQRELEEIMREAQRRAASVKKPTELWDLETI